MWCVQLVVGDATVVCKKKKNRRELRDAAMMLEHSIENLYDTAESLGLIRWKRKVPIQVFPVNEDTDLLVVSIYEAIADINNLIVRLDLPKK